MDTELKHYNTSSPAEQFGAEQLAKIGALVCKRQDFAGTAVTISIFFDGTSNNKDNTEAREVSEKIVANNKKTVEWMIANKGESIPFAENSKQDNQKFDSYYKNRQPENPMDSYGNDYTNIVKLFLSHESIIKDDDVYLPIYIEGIGTDNYEKDTVMGPAIGRGDTGVVPKAEKGCDQVIEKLKSVNCKKRIVSFKFNVFGFSRGAAAACNFIFQATDSEGKLTKALKEKGYELVQPIQIEFAGLFDCVASHSAFKYFNISDLKLDAIQKAKYTLHLTAADEHRFFFPLIDIKSMSSRCDTYRLPGVHSDIGGGYVDGAKETVKLIGKTNFELYDTYLLKWYPDSAPFRFTTNATLLKIIQRERALRIKQQWYLDDENNKQLSIIMEDVGLYDRPALIGTRQLSNNYSHIPLQIMDEIARKKDVKIIPGRVQEKYRVIPELDEIRTRLFEYAITKKKGEIDSNNTSDLNLIHVIRNKYLHWSANYALTGMPPLLHVDAEKVIRKRRVYRGGESLVKALKNYVSDNREVNFFNND